MSVNRIYFCQHGLAVDKTDNPQRPLSERGIQQTQAIANTLLKSKVHITQIYHSGKLRAAQTADIIASLLAIPLVSGIEHLSPNDNVSLLAQALDHNAALYIGHLPHLEKLVSYLVTGNENSRIIKFQNSAILCLLKEEMHYQVEWLLIPKLAEQA